MTLLTRWDPRRDLATIQDRINRFVRESYSPEGPEEALTTTNFAPPVDIYEDEHNITLKIEVPGIDEKDIDVASRTPLSRSMASARSRRKKRGELPPHRAAVRKLHPLVHAPQFGRYGASQRQLRQGYAED